eukprot:COSAG06_NODE_6779_length_2786_cov_31.443617_2_plen_596_part_00
MGISTDITVTPGQTVSVSGDGALEWAPRWGDGGFAVQARGSLSLTYIGLDPLASVTLTSGGSLSMALILALMAVPVATLSAAMAELGGADSSLRFEDMTVLEYHYDPAQTVAITVNDDGSRTQEGSLSFGSPLFNVSSGPCETSQGGQCVGRAQGYGPSEDCTISVSGGGGTLAACTVFDIAPGGEDFLTLPGGVKHLGSDCPVGVSLATDSSVAWTSDGIAQGSVGNHDFDELTDCDAMGTCGLPFTWGRLGGGWEICFVPPVPGCTNPTASDYNPAATVEDGSCTSGSPFRVGVKWENWEGIGEGAAVATLTSSPAYIADMPTSMDFLTPPALFEVHTDPAIDGMQLTAYFLAPQSGDYTFMLRSDDRGELWLGPDESTLQLIASGGWSWVDWDRYPTQTSAPQRLEEGSYYLVRALAKNRYRTGPGGVAVGVTLPDGQVLRPMPVLGYLFEPPPTIHGCTNPTATNFNLTCWEKLMTAPALAAEQLVRSLTSGKESAELWSPISPPTPRTSRRCRHPQRFSPMVHYSKFRRSCQLGRTTTMLRSRRVAGSLAVPVLLHCAAPMRRQAARSTSYGPVQAAANRARPTTRTLAA